MMGKEVQTPSPIGLPAGPLDFAVRRVRVGDEAALAAFYAALSERSRYFFQPYADWSVEAMRAVVARAVAGEDLSLVAEDAHGIFGHIFYGHMAAEVPHLGIGLLDAYHGRGLGTVLFVYLVALGKHVLKKPTIGLTVMKENRRARHLYEKFGFRIVREATFRSENDSYEMWLSFDEPGAAHSCS